MKDLKPEELDQAAYLMQAILETGRENGLRPQVVTAAMAMAVESIILAFPEADLAPYFADQRRQALEAYHAAVAADRASDPEVN